MMDQREATLNELLSEPIIRKVMARDGVRAGDIRRLLRQANARRMRPRAICETRFPEIAGRGCEWI